MGFVMLAAFHYSGQPRRPSFHP